MSNTAYLIQDKANIFYLTGFEGSSGLIILTDRSSYLITNALYYEEAKKTVPKQFKVINSIDLVLDTKKILTRHKVTTLFYEESTLSHKHFLKLKAKLKGIHLKSQSDQIEKKRQQKTPQEIKLITKSLRLAEQTLTFVSKQLKTGIKETEVAWIIEQTGRKFGAEDISFTPIVAFGKNSSTPHHQNSSTRLKKGMPILIDMGLKYKGYCSDITRTFFTKPPTKKEEEIYNTVLKAQVTAEKNIIRNMSGKKADSIARKVIEKAGYGKYFTHSLGHGVGLKVHESPTLSPKSKDHLPENSIITIEPGIYIANYFGVRIEDMVLVECDKVKNLTKIPKKIENLLLKIT